MEISEICLDKIEEDNIRDDDGYGDEAEEIRLGESLKLRQDYPIIVRPHATLAGFFLLVDGHRRNRAARRVGLKSLKAITVDKVLTQEEVRLLQLRTDMHKKHLTAHERSMAAIALEKANPGLTVKQLAALIEIGDELLWKYLQAKKLGPEATAAYKVGTLKLTAMVEVAKLSHDEQPALLSVTGGRDEVARESKKRRAAKSGQTTTVTRSSRVKVELSSGSVLSLSGREYDMSEVVEDLTSVLKDAKKAMDACWDVKTWMAVMKDRAAAV